MPLPRALPDAARQAAWDALWQKLLSTSRDGTESVPEPDPDDNEAAAEDSPAA